MSADVEQAIDDLLPTAAELAEAEKRAGLLIAARNWRAVEAEHERIDDLQADIATRAERVGIDPPAALAVLLKAELAHRTTYRRKPNAQQRAQALARAVTAAERELHAANEAVTAAHAALERATRNQIAAYGARRLTGAR